LISLKQRVIHAGSWSLAGYGLGQAIRLGSNLVMARLLMPEMFGVMAIATMVAVILTMLSDIGLRQIVVQSRSSDDPAFLDTVWVVQIVRGLLLWLGALMVSLALHFANVGGMISTKSVYASPVLPLVIAVSSLAAAITGFQSTKAAIADRNLNQKQLIRIELFSQCAALIVMFVIGVISRSIWALVIGGLVASLTSMLLSHAWLSGHTNRFRWQKGHIRELFGLGKWMLVSSFVGVFASQGDRLLLGCFVEADVMGLFAIAILIIRAIGNGLGKLFTAVMLPALSETARNDPSRLREIYYRLSVPSDLLLLFMTGLLFQVGQSVIGLLYDHRYAAAGDLLCILALSLFDARYGVAHQVYLAVGIPRYLTVISVVQFVALYALIPPLYFVGGVQAAIWGIALHGLAAVPFVYYFNARLGLIDLRREAAVLLALPIGFLSGYGLNMIRASLLTG
jgi:O-antigen/teichoic acid export membrane protein